jgi:phosphoglycolate phosphatase-like HAD superfamily hydrolase
MTDTARTATAVLFDIDGTLVDSNYLHVESWARTFRDLGVDVDTWRIHRAIGLDSSKLLEELLGDRLDELGDRAKELHTDHYSPLVDRLRPFHRATELLGVLAGRGTRVVLATSAPEEELVELRRVLDVEDSLHAVTSSADVETAKPEPDVIQVALDEADVPPERALMIGDARWDGIAADRAGVPFVGVLTGGISEAELREAGAIAVYSSVADLLENLDDSPIATLLDADD